MDHQGHLGPLLLAGDVLQKGHHLLGVAGGGEEDVIVVGRVNELNVHGGGDGGDPELLDQGLELEVRPRGVGEEDGDLEAVHRLLKEALGVGVVVLVVPHHTVEDHPGHELPLVGPLAVVLHRRPVRGPRVRGGPGDGPRPEEGHLLLA